MISFVVPVDQKEYTHRLHKIVNYLSVAVAPSTAIVENDQGFIYALSGSHLSNSWSVCQKTKSELVEINVSPEWHESYIAMRFL